MAKKQTKAVVPVKKAAPPAIEGRSKYAGQGQDEIGQDEILMPRLKLGQAMSPEVKDGDVEEGDLFNSVTGEIICKAGESMPVIVVARTREYILWDDRKGDNRGMLARAHKVTLPSGETRFKWNHPGQTFEVKVDGKTKVKYKLGTYIEDDGLYLWGTQIPGNEETPPAANEHYNYIFALPERDYELIAVSMSKTAVPIAKKLNTAIFANKKTGMFEMQFTLKTFIDNRGENKFANFQVEPGWERVSDEVADMMKPIFDGFRAKIINVEDAQDDFASEPAGDRSTSKKGGASASKKF
jgi:hypothetical protein